MGNNKIKNYYSKLAATITKATETRNKAPDFSQFDIAYMKKRADTSKSLLDLGAGSGLLLNSIAQDFGNIVAVELHAEFSQFIEQGESVTVINQDIMTFDTDQTFDNVIAFGVLNFFSAEEAAKIYEKCFRFVKPDGELVIKHQMGLEEDVVIDGFSEELQHHYFSEYRYVAHEKQLIESAGFILDSQTDIYPDEYNRWPNTRFFAISATRPK